MKRFCVMVIVKSLNLLMPLPAVCQYYFYNDRYLASDWVIEAGSSGGTMNSLTDLGGRKGAGGRFIKDLNWRATRPDASVFILASYKSAIALRFEITKGSIRSSDNLLKNTDPNLIGRYGRNLSFRSGIFEFQLCQEFHPLFFSNYDENKAPFWSPYLVTGIGYFSFNPQASLDGKWHNLQPLRLEGQGTAAWPTRKPYKLKQFNIPAGVGIKYEISSLFNVCIEVVHRILFTDYIDDVSTTYIDPFTFSIYLAPEQVIIAQRLYSRMQELQPGYVVKKGMPRGDPSDKDAFFSIQMKLSFCFRRKF